MAELENIARKVNKEYALNKFLQKKLKIYKQYYILTKEIMKKTMQNKNNSPLLLLSQYSEEIQKDYKNLKNEIININIKFDSLLEECWSDLTMGKPILAQKKNEDFSNEFKIMEKTDIINTIKKCIKLSKDYRLFREPKREIFADLKKGNKEMENLARELHQNMLYDLRKSNKIINKIKKYELKKESISKNIGLLKNYIELKDLKVSNCEIFSKNIKKKKKDSKYESALVLSQRDNKIIQIGKQYIEDEDDLDNNNNSDDDRKNKKSERLKNKIIKEFTKIEDLFDLSEEEGESEEIIDDELHSDDETFFENRIKPASKLSVQYLKKIKSSIPELNLKQIEFNSQKKEQEIDLYSLERRKYKNKNINGQIKEMKSKIDKINIKLTLLKRKENQMREFIKKSKRSYESIKPIIYQNSVANIIQKDFIFNSLNKEIKNEKSKKTKEKFNDLHDINDINEVDEINYNENEENEKSDDKKETKETRKEEEIEDKKMQKNNILKRQNNISHFIKNYKKQKNRKLLISFNPSSFKNNDWEKPKSK